MSKSFVVLLGLLAFGACDQRRSEPFVGERIFTEQELRGEVLFFRHCNECHPQGESGLGPSLNDKILPDFFVKNQVRNPLALMPEFEEDRISDAELEDLVEFTKAVKRQDAKTPAAEE
jgi:mono/diheme cytochrome c family protein